MDHLSHSRALSAVVCLTPPLTESTQPYAVLDFETGYGSREGLCGTADTRPVLPCMIGPGAPNLPPATLSYSELGTCISYLLREALSCSFGPILHALCCPPRSIELDGPSPVPHRHGRSNIGRYERSCFA